jgi:hypothetical protein
MALRKKPHTLGGELTRRNYTREYWDDGANTLVIAAMKTPDATTSYRLIRKDGTGPWKYQPARPNAEATLNGFMDTHGLDPQVFHKVDCVTIIKMFTTFLVESMDLVHDDEANLVHIAAKLWIPGLDKRIDFDGGAGTTSAIADARFYHKFNELYPGCSVKKTAE